MLLSRCRRNSTVVSSHRGAFAVYDGMTIGAFVVLPGLSYHYWLTQSGSGSETHISA